MFLRSLALISLLSLLIEDNKDQELILAIGWDKRFFGVEGLHRRDLDALESARPVVIMEITMHSLWANTRALELSVIGDNPALWGAAFS
jgi:predicted amidohydrolase YtcJ